MHYYKRHLGDYARDTGHLTALEHGIYTLLLDWYYVNERPIPADKANRIARGNPQETETVLREFFHLTDEGWRHHRADREIESYAHRAEVNREVGKLGGRPKKTQTVSERKPISNPQETLTTNHKPLTTNQEPEDQKNGAPDGDAPPGNEKPKAKRSKADKPPEVEMPEGVDPQTWADWLTLRKRKSAPVTQTVLREAIRESEKAGMTLERFLTIWCARGSQGLEASWLKPHERAGPNGKPSAAANFRETTYTGTAYDDLPPELR